MASQAYLKIREAIQKKQQIIATTRNDGLAREMCPHTIGLSKRGDEQALFYQFGGRSKHGLDPDGSPKNWRCIPIDNLSEVSSREGEWHSAGRDTRPQRCVQRIDLEVAY